MTLSVGLSAVIVAVIDGAPHVLATRGSKEYTGDGLPFGAFDPAGHRTFEIGLRDWVSAQTGFEIGYVEQLYTFGDQGRDLPIASLEGFDQRDRVISVGYLALTPEATEIGGAFEAIWRDWYRYFPWEDHRKDTSDFLDRDLKPALIAWSKKTGHAATEKERWDRVSLAFGFDGKAWVEERAIERYELLYEAQIVPEFWRDRGRASPSGLSERVTGVPMRSDHRRILATAISRLRGKIKYRPVIFEFMDEFFTLSALQETAEGVLGYRLHKQNFRRALDKSGFVEGTGTFETATGGRPAERFRFTRDATIKKTALGIQTPRLK